MGVGSKCLRGRGLRVAWVGRKKKQPISIWSTREAIATEIHFNVDDETKQSVAVGCGGDDDGAGSGVQGSGVPELVGGGLLSTELGVGCSGSGLGVGVESGAGVEQGGGC